MQVKKQHFVVCCSLQTLNNLTAVLTSQGKAGEAPAYWQPNSPQPFCRIALLLHSLQSLSNLAVVLTNQGIACCFQPCPCVACCTLPAQSLNHLAVVLTSHRQSWRSTGTAAGSNRSFVKLRIHKRTTPAFWHFGEPCPCLACCSLHFHIQSLNNLAVVLTSQGKAGEALALLQAAIAALPSYAEAHNNLGVLQRDVGAISDALASYERALSLAPDARNAGEGRHVQPHV
jgi:tetratricopeptide (TPR) repeat protein